MPMRRMWVCPTQRPPTGWLTSVCCPLRDEVVGRYACKDAHFTLPTGVCVCVCVCVLLLWFLPALLCDMTC